MKITPINYLHTKNNLKSKSTQKENASFLVCKNQTLPIVEVSQLSSKFNINFTSKSCLKALEKKIDVSLNPDDSDIAQMKSAIKTNSDVQYISKIFEQDKIDDVYYTGISLNAAVRYLTNKRHIKLRNMAHPKNIAFFVDDLAVSYMQNLKKKNKIAFLNFKNKMFFGNVVFYSFNQTNEENKKLKKKLEDTLNCKIKIKALNNSNNQKETMFPKADEIEKSIIECADEVSFDSVEKYEKFVETAKKYLDSMLMCYSYQKLANELKRTYSILEQYMMQKGKTMDDVLYYIPQLSKSYDIINYIFAVENNIAQSQFRNFKDSTLQDKTKTYVIIDDCAFTGNSIIEAAMRLNFNVQPEEIIAVPLLASKNAIQKVSKENYFKFMPMRKYPSIFDVESEISTDKTKIGASNDDLDLLFNSLHSGIGEQYTCAIFPYMIPDNSSNLAGKIGEYFLIDNNFLANKANI